MMTISDSIRELYEDDPTLSYTEISEILECTYGQVHQVLTKYKADNVEKKMPLSYLTKNINANNAVRVKKWIINHCDNPDFKQALMDVNISKYKLIGRKIHLTMNLGQIINGRYETLFDTNLMECMSTLKNIFPANTTIVHQHIYLCYQAEIQL